MIINKSIHSPPRVENQEHELERAPNRGKDRSFGESTRDLLAVKVGGRWPKLSEQLSHPTLSQHWSAPPPAPDHPISVHFEASPTLVHPAPLRKPKKTPTLPTAFEAPTDLGNLVLPIPPTNTTAERASRREPTMIYELVCHHPEFCTNLADWPFFARFCRQ